MNSSSTPTNGAPCSSPDQDRETEILLALEEVEHARLTEKDRVEMYGKDGRLLLTLSRLNLTQDES